MRCLLKILVLGLFVSSSNAQPSINYAVLKNVDINNLKRINTNDLEFSPILYREGLAFITTGDESKEFDKNIKENYFDWTYHNLENGDKTFLSDFFRINKANEHIGPGVIDSANNLFYYTQSKKSKKRNKRPLNKIYKAKQDSSGWLPLGEINLNSNEWSCQHPAISTDGKMMIYSANPPESIGGYDLYASYWQDSIWGEPQNLGTGVNSPLNEAFTSLYQDSVLFFATNGRGGMGSYDIFVSIYKDGIWQNAINLGKRLNSEKDDIGLIMDPSGRRAYISSNRSGGQGKDDIYQANFEADLIIFAELLPIVLNTSREIYDLTVKLESSDGTKIDEAFISLLPIQDGDELTLSGFDIESINPVEGKNGFLMNIVPKSGSSKSPTLVTDSTGTVMFQIEKGQNYLVTVQKNGYLPFTTSINGGEMVSELTLAIENIQSNNVAQTIDTPDTPDTKMDSSSEKTSIVEKNSNNVEILVFDQLYYDYGSTNISTQSIGQLDQLVKFLTENPETKIELVAHTDSRGDEDFNLKLSVERAQAAKTYLVNNGVSDFRVKAFGKGEKDLRNHCSSGVYCTEKEHEYNRRTEVRIIYD